MWKIRICDNQTSGITKLNDINIKFIKIINIQENIKIAEYADFKIKSEYTEIILKKLKLWKECIHHKMTMLYRIKMFSVS